MTRSLQYTYIIHNKLHSVDIPSKALHMIKWIIVVMKQGKGEYAGNDNIDMGN